MPIDCLPCVLHIGPVHEPIALAEKRPLFARFVEPAWHAVHALFDERSHCIGTILRDVGDASLVHWLPAVLANIFWVQFTSNTLQQLNSKYVPVLVITHMIQQRSPLVVCEIGVGHCACLYFCCTSMLITCFTAPLILFAFLLFAPLICLLVICPI